jgi:hypothetical protein
VTLGTQIQMVFIPLWARVLVGVLILGSLGVSVSLFWTALTGAERPDWITAGAQLLGVVFPVAILGIVLGGGAFGDASILKRTEQVLRQTIPYHLQFLVDDAQRWRDFRSGRRSPLTDAARLARIDLHHSRGRCLADYRIRVPLAPAPVTLHLRVELNVRRVNINLLLPAARIDALQQNGETLLQTVRRLFPHSTAAMDVADDAGQIDQAHPPIRYRLNPSLLQRQVDGQPCVAIVATAAVAHDLVWNPSEKVYFAQDLCFMLKSFLQENPAAFADGVAP